VDNQTQVALQAYGFHPAQERLSGEWRMGWTRGADARGVLDTPLADTLDRWKQTQLQAQMRLGDDESIWSLEGGYGWLDKRYDEGPMPWGRANRRDQQGFLKMRWRVWPQTHALLEGQASTHRYPQGAYVGNSTDRLWQAGLQWQASTALKAVARWGPMRKSLASASRDGFSGHVWQAGLDWQPWVATRFSWSHFKALEESTGLGDFSVHQVHQLSWRQAWDHRFDWSMDYSRKSVRYQGLMQDTVDELQGVSLLLQYRWRGGHPATASVGLGFKHETRDAAQMARDFQRRALWLQLQAGL
jgi:hypothetical protein